VSGGILSSKGGGYFIQVGTKGIVIDPGFNFIENFIAAGHKFKEIDYVFISHAHNDHTADLDSLLTILHRYNKELRESANCEIQSHDFKFEEGSLFDSTLKHLGYSLEDVRENECLMKDVKDEIQSEIKKRRKKIRFYMSAATRTKYSGFFKLKDEMDYEIFTIDYEHTKEFAIEDMKVSIIKARHDDIVSDYTAVGFCFSQSDFKLIYTGDTNFLDVEDFYTEFAQSASYIKEKVVLVANLGGFKRSELLYTSGTDNPQHYYKNHLGRIGLAKLIDILKPQLCIISEFGEELDGYRRSVANAFKAVYKDEGTMFLPADIGLCVKYESEQITVKAIASTDIKDEKFIDPFNVKVDVIMPISQLYYFDATVNDRDLVDKQTAELKRILNKISNQN
jgi:ribonuclease BN (tRNA processing enzyme)